MRQKLGPTNSREREQCKIKLNADDILRWRESRISTIKSTFATIVTLFSVLARGTAMASIFAQGLRLVL